MLLRRCTLSKAFSSFRRSVALCLFDALYEPFKAFLCLPVNVGKIGVQPAACEKIRICTPAALLQIVQMLPPE